MKIITKIKELKEWLLLQKNAGYKIGLVPTMGFLHKGHLSLVDESILRGLKTVVSIYVNPTQFLPGEDLDSYPKDLKGDCFKLEKAGADIVFMPDSLYENGNSVNIAIENSDSLMCGADRPNHFTGVLTIVAKLFNCVEADTAFFGWKDAQQFINIKRMAEELCFDTNIVACPIIRENDGLAMSSRNIYLSKTEREESLCLYKSLCLAKELYDSGELEFNKIKFKMVQVIKSLAPKSNINYIDAVDLKLNRVTLLDKDILLALSVTIGKTRLIDNIIF